jgi:hypothetical protein
LWGVEEGVDDEIVVFIYIGDKWVSIGE